MSYREIVGIFSIFSSGGHFVQQSRIMVGNHNGAFQRKNALLVHFRGNW